MLHETVRVTRSLQSARSESMTSGPNRSAADAQEAASYCRTAARLSDAPAYRACMLRVADSLATGAPATLPPEFPAAWAEAFDAAGRL